MIALFPLIQSKKNHNKLMISVAISVTEINVNFGKDLNLVNRWNKKTDAPMSSIATGPLVITASPANSPAKRNS